MPETKYFIKYKTCTLTVVDQKRITQTIIKYDKVLHINVTIWFYYFFIFIKLISTCSKFYTESCMGWCTTPHSKGKFTLNKTEIWYCCHFKPSPPVGDLKCPPVTLSWPTPSPASPSVLFIMPGFGWDSS